MFTLAYVTFVIDIVLMWIVNQTIGIVNQTIGIVNQTVSLSHS